MVCTPVYKVCPLLEVTVSQSLTQLTTLSPLSTKGQKLSKQVQLKQEHLSYLGWSEFLSHLT